MSAVRLVPPGAAAGAAGQVHQHEARELQAFPPTEAHIEPDLSRQRGHCGAWGKVGVPFIAELAQGLGGWGRVPGPAPRRPRSPAEYRALHVHLRVGMLQELQHRLQVIGRRPELPDELEGAATREVDSHQLVGTVHVPPTRLKPERSDGGGRLALMGSAARAVLTAC